MRIQIQKHSRTFTVIGLLVALATALLPLVTASCKSQRALGGEAAAIERLRAMTRGDVLPAESVIASLESEGSGTRLAALARMLRARVRLAARDYAGAATLLEARDIRVLTALGDYALFLRAQALEGAGRRVEARAAYEQVAREYPSSRRARESILRGAALVQEASQSAAVPLLVKTLTDGDDAGALLLAARAYEQQGDGLRALALYRRLYFYAPASDESAEAPAAMMRLSSTPSPATPEEATTRADKLFAAKRYAEAADAYTDAFARFASAGSLQAQLRRGIASASARRVPEAIAALNAIPITAGETRAEAMHHLTLLYARARQWEAARSAAESLRRAFPQSAWTMRALVAAGQAAKDAKNLVDANYFFRAAVSAFPGHAEVAGAQFEIAWAAHEAKNFQESSRLLIEHLAQYADRNTDNRGRAGYWAARDAERAGRMAEARAIYAAMDERYGATWYGYLSKQRLDAMARSRPSAESPFASNSPIGLAVAHLRTVTIAEETVGTEADERLAKADQLSVIGLDDWAHEELDYALQHAPTSPRLNLAKARIFRSRTDNLQAFNVLRRSFPDYSQMKPEEMTREEWDVFYPLAHWEIITQEARAKNLDPYMVAGLIRQESVFNPRAVSSARAYGLMQLLVPTGKLVAKRFDVQRSVTVESLFEPRLNIQLGTGYLRDQLDKFGRIEYVAAAYNAGPNRAVQWRAALPLEIDEWVEAIPFKETRGYVQGVVRNMLQYRRLYDEQGRFRPAVGTRAAHSDAADAATTPTAAPASQSGRDGVRPRRVTNNDEENEE